MSEPFGAHDAMDLIATESTRMRRSLEVSTASLLLAWGLAWLVGYGAMWWDVRDQSDYTGPGAVSGIIFAVSLISAAVYTGISIGRATNGVSGRAERAGRWLGAAWALGFAGFYGIVGAMLAAGINHDAKGIIFATLPIFITGLIYLLMAALFDEALTGWLGAWLIVVAGAAGFAGPIGVLLIGALAGGGGFLVAAALAHRGRADA